MLPHRRMYEFQAEFKAIAESIPDVAGDPVAQEQWEPNGDVVQPTTTGMMIWRRRDGWTAFTDGYRIWVNGPNGLESRMIYERLDWESEESAA